MINIAYGSNLDDCPGGLVVNMFNCPADHEVPGSISGGASKKYLPIRTIFSMKEYIIINTYQ